MRLVWGCVAVEPGNGDRLGYSQVRKEAAELLASSFVNRAVVDMMSVAVLGASRGLAADVVGYLPPYQRDTKVRDRAGDSIYWP
jgi:hypothetical protein